MYIHLWGCKFMANTWKPPHWSPMNNKSTVILPDKLQSAYTQIDSYSKETRNQIVWLYRKLWFIRTQTIDYKFTSRRLSTEILSVKHFDNLVCKFTLCHTMSIKCWCTRKLFGKLKGDDVIKLCLKILEILFSIIS